MHQNGSVSWFVISLVSNELRFIEQFTMSLEKVKDPKNVFYCYGDRFVYNFNLEDFIKYRTNRLSGFTFIYF